MKMREAFGEIDLSSSPRPKWLLDLLRMTSPLCVCFLPYEMLLVRILETVDIVPARQ